MTTYGFNQSEHLTPLLLGSGSFEELMMLAQTNSKQGSFGSSIRKPEDVLREQKKKEAQREREKQQFLVGKSVIDSNSLY